MDIRKCSVIGCEGGVNKKGLCVKHYHRQHKYGDVETVMVIRGDDIGRFKSHIKNDESSGCILWSASSEKGYGRFYLNGKLEKAHRAAWKLFVGEIPKGMQINHKCHNRLCVNTNHLYVGTQKENMMDMKLAGRDNNAKGEKTVNSKLTEFDVVKIRSLEGTTASISRMFNVSESLIRQIRQGKCWRYLL